MHTNISGVFPHTAVKAAHSPARTETGIGALMPWADRLWFITYVAHKSRSGGGTGLFWLDDEMTLHKHPASVVGTYANRIIHKESSQLFIGPHAIDTEGNVRTIDALVNIRITATCRHLTDPANKVYCLGMEGELFEVDVHSLAANQIAELTRELATSGKGDAHFKDAYCDGNRLVVANNSYYDRDFPRNDACDGRLAEFDGTRWNVLERTQFNTVNGVTAGKVGSSIYAFGQDAASALMKLWLPRTGWQTYRLPKATHTQDHAWYTEWPRIREVESERWLLNASGMFYEVPLMSYADRPRGIRPVCSHLRIVGDFCSWNGLLVMAGDQTTPISDSNPHAGQPQANLWFGKTDDLWGWGKPAGWGGPFYETPVTAGRPSDPYLMTGFEHKCLHAATDRPMGVHVEVDITGAGHWVTAARLKCPGGEGVSHVFPTGYSAHWLRLTPDADGVATAVCHYT